MVCLVDEVETKKTSAQSIRTYDIVHADLSVVANWTASVECVDVSDLCVIGLCFLDRARECKMHDTD